MSSQWKPGQSGNPNGRPRGSGEIARLRAGISERIPEIIDALISKALAGDISAARIILDRTLPPLRAQEHPLTFELPEGSFTNQGRAILQAVSQEEVNPRQGAMLISSVAHLARIAEIDELTNRVAALEERMKCQR